MDDTTNLALCHYGDEEDYIDMELNSSPQSREFEFQTSTTCNERETTTSPADELFYKGKLLPLHLPPRRLMVQNLLQTTAATTATTTTTTTTAFEEDHYYSIPFPTCSSTNTPSDSCNISPSESCRVSCELNPDDYFFEWSNELNTLINNHPTKIPWSKKLKLMKLSTLNQKLKSSTAYLKSLFVKSACSDESCAKAGGAQTPPKSQQEFSSNYSKTGKKKPLDISAHPTIASIINNIDKDGGIEDSAQRRSFSSAIKRHSPTKCLSSSSSSNSSSAASSSSSSFSLNSNGFHHQPHFLGRSSSATEIEGSIEAAIAHCKKSHTGVRFEMI